MTTLPPIRPPTPSAPRPAAPGPASSAPTGLGMPAIDPVKLFQKYKWLLGAAVVVGAVLGVGAHYALRATFPIYTSVMIFEVTAQKSDLGILGPGMGFEKELEKFMASQVAIMTSERIADTTAADPRLTREAPKFAERFVQGGVVDVIDASKAIRRRVSGSIMGETQFIRLSAWDWQPDTATALLKVVGENYIKQRQDQAGGENRDRVAGLTNAIDDNKRRVDQLRDQRKRLLADNTVDALDANSTEARGRMMLLQQQLVELAANRQALITQRDEMERQLASPAGISYSDRIRQRVEDHPNMLGLRRDLNSIEAQLMAARQRMGAAHRDVMRIENIVQAQRQKIDLERERLLREEFDAQLDQLRTAIKSGEASELDLMKRFEDAKTRANELTETLSRVKDLDRDIEGTQNAIQKFQDQLSSIDVLTDRGRENRVTIYQPAMSPKSVTFPRLQIMIPLGVIAVTGLVGGIVLLRELLDQRVKSPADVAMIPRTRVLGLVPHAAEDPSAPPKMETVFRDQPRGVLAESYRQLRGALSKRMQQAGHKSLLVVSGMPASGATTVVTNLAFAWDAAEQRVLVLDANLRRPAVHKALGLREAPGLADVLAGQATFEEAVQRVEGTNLDVLTAGTSSLRVYERLGSNAMGELLAKAAASHDLVVIDVSPAMVSGDAAALANRCDASLLVVKAMGEKRGMVARLRSELSETRAEFMGVLVNAVRASAGGYLRGNIMASHSYQNGGAEEKAS